MGDDLRVEDLNMKSIVPLLVIFALFLSQPRSSEASAVYSGIVSGTFTSPALSGPIINVGGTQSVVDNTSTAVVTGVGTNALTWGTNVAGSAPPVFSNFVFTGIPFTNVPAGAQFDLGTFSYLNGTSQTDSLIFGITLNLSFSGDSSVTPAVSRISILTTVNGGVDIVADADYINFNTFCPDPSLPMECLSFNVYEGRDALATLKGAIIGDPQLTLQAITLAPNDPNGFLGNGQGSSMPEPGSIILSSLGLIGVAVVRRFRAAQR
jgi:hypothetical protein